MTSGGTAKAALRKTMMGLAIISALTLVGCSSPGTSAPGGSSGTAVEKPAEAVEEPAAPLDLTGTWRQTNSSGEGSFMAVAIDEATVTATLVNEADDTSTLFWAGSYVPPTEDADSYSWDSVNDTTQTEKSILGSSDPTKSFAYSDSVLTFPMSIMGVTKTVELERQ
jgi:hypothetical protein